MSGMTTALFYLGIGVYFAWRYAPPRESESRAFWWFMIVGTGLLWPVVLALAVVLWGQDTIERMAGVFPHRRRRPRQCASTEDTGPADYSSEYPHDPKAPKPDGWGWSGTKAPADYAEAPIHREPAATPAPPPKPVCRHCGRSQ